MTAADVAMPPRLRHASGRSLRKVAATQQLQWHRHTINILDDEMQIKATLALLLTVALTACSAPTMDTSTEELAKESAKTIRESLTEEKRAQFTEALTVISVSKVDVKALMNKSKSADDVKSDVMASVHGKNADEIIAMAEQIKAAAKERKRAKALEDIAELEGKQQAAEQAQILLQAVAVSGARFSLKPQRYTNRPQPTIQLTVKNGLDKAISRVYFHGSIESVGRSVPWFTGNFNYAIPGGLEPGESKDLVLEPNMFSDWASVEAPNDAVFLVATVRVDGADNEALVDSLGFSERDAKRLAELKGSLE